MREKLPNDGAAYPCCFMFEDWRCPNTATEGVTIQREVEIRDNPQFKKIVLMGRALCNGHLKFFGE